MKELEKTKRISISATLFLLVVIIGLLTFRKPEFSFKNKADKTLEFIIDSLHTMTLSQFEKIEDSSFTLVDVRSNFDFSKGHINKAINIPLSQLLDKTTLENLSPSENPQTLILYGKTPEEANAALLLLYQLGYHDLILLSVKTFYVNKQFHAKKVIVGQADLDYSMAMKKAQTQPVKKVISSTKKQAKKKKVITKPKKKKKMPEGGC